MAKKAPLPHVLAAQLPGGKQLAEQVKPKPRPGGPQSPEPNRPKKNTPENPPTAPVPKVDVPTPVGAGPLIQEANQKKLGTLVEGNPAVPPLAQEVAPPTAPVPLTSKAPLPPLPKEAPKVRKIIYPEVKAHTLIGDKALTEAQMKKFLGWETEDEFKKRKMAEDPKLQEEQCNYGDEYLLIDFEGNKVRCWNNDDNRPFTEAWCKQLAQDFLNRKWAGTGGRDGETINGEAIIIGRTGKILSAQHRGIGFVLACQMWRGKNKLHWQEVWKTEPRFPTILVWGIDEDIQTVSTLDNVRPRTLSDVITTSAMFKDLDSQDRKKADRMLASATDMLWKRTGMESAPDSYTKYQTHATSVEFMRNHPRLSECVRHLFEQNSDNALSVLKLNAGRCAALLYMMGSCNSDGMMYRNAETAIDRKEAGLDWTFWDRAKKFWCLFADTKSRRIQLLRDAKRPNVGDETIDTFSGKIFAKGDQTSTEPEKTAQIIKYWNLWAEEERPLTDLEIRLAYRFSLTDDEERVESFTLTDRQDLNGIDQGDPKTSQEEGAVDSDGRAISSVDPKVEPSTSGVPTTSAGKENETPEQEKLRRQAMEGTATTTSQPGQQRKIAGDVSEILRLRAEQGKTSEPEEDWEDEEDDEPTLEEEIEEMPDPDDPTEEDEDEVLADELYEPESAPITPTPPPAPVAPPVQTAPPTPRKILRKP